MLSGFKNTSPWWRTKVDTKIVLSDNGISDLFQELGKRRALFIADLALSYQPLFAPVFEQPDCVFFNAGASEPKTGDVDEIVAKYRAQPPEVVVAVGGGGTMDLAKATGICLGNPESAAFYQGWGYEMNPGVPVWTVPTLSGTGAEFTPIAVLRGPEKKLGINSPLVTPALTIIDPSLTRGVPFINRFYTMMDCYYHHYEITFSKTSEENAIKDAVDGLALAREVLDSDLLNYNEEVAIKAAKASVLGGSSTIGGRVGASHAISYGLSNSAPALPHSVAVTMAMLGLADVYKEGRQETVDILARHNIAQPKARNYGIGIKDIDKLIKTALGMDKLWLSHFGQGWESTVTPDFLRNIYQAIIEA